MALLSSGGYLYSNTTTLWISAERFFAHLPPNPYQGQAP